MTTTYDLEAQAAKARADSARYYRAARRDANRAASAYRTARQVEQHAAWLTRRADLAEPGYEYTPASLEAEARTWVSIADTFLRGSFHSTDHARFYNGLARRYDRMAADRAAYLATA